MPHFKFVNVNDAFYKMVGKFHSGYLGNTITSPSRNGEVVSCLDPVAITYGRPLERVLFNSARDANPFFHLFESLWMLAGRNDLAPLEYYVSTFGDFSDDGETLNGAYGYRWRRAAAVTHGKNAQYYDPFEEIDQLKILVQHLKDQPWSRRAVLQMWNVEDDLLKIDDQHGNFSKDVCCNIYVKFRIEPGMCPKCNGLSTSGFDACDRCEGTPHDQPRYLHMNVHNRSNDMILGMFGANVVHFSFLHEYMAAHLGLEVGSYNQISDDLHIYSSNWKPESWLDSHVDHYQGRIKHFPLIKDPKRFDEELPKFVGDWETYCTEPFLREVAAPMCLAFRHHKEREYGLALEAMSYVKADDWKIAGLNWISKRKANWERKHAKRS